MTIPNIVTYGPTPDAPAHMTYAAAMVTRTIPAKGKVPAHTEPGTSWLATGPTPEAARQKLLDIWVKQNPPPAKRKVKADPDLDVVL